MTRDLAQNHQKYDAYDVSHAYDTPQQSDKKKILYEFAVAKLKCIDYLSIRVPFSLPNFEAIFPHHVMKVVSKLLD